MKQYKIIIEPFHKIGEFPQDTSILTAIRHLNISLTNNCGGTGSCGKCVIKILNGRVSPITSVEEKFLQPVDINQGYRLACQALITGDCQVYLPLVSIASLHRTQVESLEVPVQPDPATRIYQVTLTSPTLEKPTPDLENLQKALAQEHCLSATLIDLKTLRSLSDILRKNHGRVNCAIRGNEITGVFPPTTPATGVAIDLGTTKLALYLMNLVTGQVLQSRGLLNPQISYGDDIISRMTAAIRCPEDAKKLQEKVTMGINEAVAEMCQLSNLSPDTIAEYVIVGNTAMHHLLLGLPVKYLCQSPFVPVLKSPLDVKARDIGLKGSSGAYVHLLPNIAGFVGSDHVAMLLATGMHHKDRVALAIDIGTNTEICLASQKKLVSVSCASGPAFEGAHIKHGVRAVEGAIEHFQFINGKTAIQTVGNKPPIGICGSGILDIVAQLYLNGTIDRTGRLQLKPGVREEKGIREFIVFGGDTEHKEITFTQNDIREVQLAKGAIRTGIEILLKENHLIPSDVEQVIIAGAFGSYIDITSAVTIGMLPDLPPERFLHVGNAAGMGAKIALINRQKRDEATKIAEQVSYLEVALHPDFKDLFSRTLLLGKYNP